MNVHNLNHALHCHVVAARQLMPHLEARSRRMASQLYMVVTRDTSQLDISPLKVVAASNLQDMAVDRRTSQLDISSLKAVAALNM